MPRYRKIPAEVEAIELQWQNYQAMCDMIQNSVCVTAFCYIDNTGMPTDKWPGPRADSPVSRIGLKISSPEGYTILAVEGDYVVKYSDGHLYVYHEDTFKETYEPVPEADGIDDLLESIIERLTAVNATTRSYTPTIEFDNGNVNSF